MKKLHHNVRRGGHDRIQIEAMFRNRMREPMDVKIVAAKLPDAAAAGTTQLWEGDVAEVMGLFGGLAEIAWELGWRPRGLAGKLAYMVDHHKIPPEEG